MPTIIENCRDVIISLMAVILGLLICSLMGDVYFMVYIVTLLPPLLALLVAIGRQIEKLKYRL